MEGEDESFWLPRVGFVYCFERMLFVRMVNAVLDRIEKDSAAFPSMHSESIPVGERLSEKIHDNRNEWVFWFVGRRFRLKYTYCYETQSSLSLCELVDNDFETFISKQPLVRSDDMYDHPRGPSVGPEECMQRFVEILALRFPRDEAGNLAS
jgi:hypothetical protein